MEGYAARALVVSQQHTELVVQCGSAWYPQSKVDAKAKKASELASLPKADIRKQVEAGGRYSLERIQASVED